MRAGETVETAATAPPEMRAEPRERSTAAFKALVAFSFLYYGRPGDLIPGMAAIPVAKITGGIALAALIFGVSSNGKFLKFPTELKLLMAMFAWFWVGVPFAFWRGGALDVVINQYSKPIIVALLVGLLVTSVAQLRRLVFVQAAAVAATTVLSMVLYRGDGRMTGALGGMLGNPNDLAMNIALNWPLCLYFLLEARSPLKKALWGAAMLAMIRGVMLTYSRSGFLAITVGIAFCLWEFAVRGRRYHMIIGAMLLALPLIVFIPGRYATRLTSIVWRQQGDMDRGSAEAREELLKESLKITATHPIFGVGAGNFPAYTKSWLVTHNTYTQLSSEGGIPALILFLLVMRKAFCNIKGVRKSAEYAGPQVRMLAGALWASLAAYMVGAFFASTADELFPYFMVAYTTALYRIACAAPIAEPVKVTRSAQVREHLYGRA